MKIKILCFILGCLMLSYSAAQAIEDNNTTKNSIRFIYLNGSNANDEKARQDYTDGVFKTQKQIKLIMENDETISKNLLENGKYTINERPSILFWGFQSQKSLNAVNNDLAIASLVSPKIAQSVRKLISHCLHDAIWIQKDHNMKKVMDQLHRMVIDAHEQGEKVILLGHSAGSFVTFNYLLHKIKAVDIDTLMDRKAISNHEHCTCADAIIDSKLGYQLANGNIVLDVDRLSKDEIYKRLDRFSEKSCMPDNTVAGIINFGSPLSLFYPDIAGGDSLVSEKQQFAFVKHILEDNIFYLTVNFADDPIGFPVGRNGTAQDIEMQFNSSIDKNARGFLYNYSSVKSPATFASAHSSYWKHPKKFAKMCKDAYIKGLQNFYGFN